MLGRGVSMLIPLGVGVAAGVLVTVLTQAATRSTIGGVVDGTAWSLTGNGALVVPFVGVPAVLGAGWAALALRAVGRRRWGAAGLGAFALLVALGLATEFDFLLAGPPVVGAAAGLLAGLAALGFARAAGPLDRPTIATGLAVAALAAVAQGTAGLLFPLPVAVAIRGRERRTFLPGDCLALAVGLVAGIVASIPLASAIAGWWYDTRAGDPAG